MTTPSVTKPTVAADAPCPCGSGKTFGECCQPVIAGQRVAPDAEALMRSRFTAHVLQDFGHLHRTDLETAATPYVEEAPEEQPIQWTRLTINAHEPGATADKAFVDFSAFYKAGAGEAALHEKSEFVRKDGVWYYLRAIRTGPAPKKAAPKVGRNDPCPCGSGKKYKHCCLAA